MYASRLESAPSRLQRVSIQTEECPRSDIYAASKNGNARPPARSSIPTHNRRLRPTGSAPGASPVAVKCGNGSGFRLRTSGGAARGQNERGEREGENKREREREGERERTSGRLSGRHNSACRIGTRSAVQLDPIAVRWDPMRRADQLAAMRMFLCPAFTRRYLYSEQQLKCPQHKNAQPSPDMSTLATAV